MAGGKRRGMKNSGKFLGEIPLVIEYLSPEDDAWYSVRLRLDGESIGVNFVDFPSESGQCFAAGSFRESGDLEAFQERFRPTSEQLQDGQCRRAIEGVTVCAAHSAREDDVRFYDAVIETVFPAEHKVIDGEEQCLCKFMLLWQHGPNAGSTTCTNIANICLLQHGNPQIHPVLDAFVNISRKKIDQRMQSCINSECRPSDGSVVSHRSVSTVVGEDLVGTSSFSHSNFHHPISRNSTGITMTRRDVNSYTSPREREERVDLGSEVEHVVSRPKMMTYWHYFIIDNLEPDLSPVDIMEFIYHHTSILCKVFLVPMLSTEYYARGVVFLEGQGNVRKLSSFLGDPSELIMSSTGRPWLISECRSATLDMIYGSLGLNLKDINIEYEQRHLPKSLKIASEGTFEYSAGFKRKQLFVEFQHHLEGLHKNLEECFRSLSGCRC